MFCNNCGNQVPDGSEVCGNCGYQFSQAVSQQQYYSNQGTNKGEANGGNFAIASLVCGILGIAGGSIPIVQYFTLALAILGIVLGVKARKTAPPDKRGMATAGLVLGIIAVGLNIIGIICVVWMGAALLSVVAGYM
jgi:hypothetical protein